MKACKHNDDGYEKTAKAQLLMALSTARVSIDHPRKGQNRAFQHALSSMHFAEGMTFREIENSPLQFPHSTAERHIKRFIEISSQVMEKIDPRAISLPLSQEQCDSISKVYLALRDICPNSRHSNFEPFKELLLYERDRSQTFECMLTKAGCSMEDLHSTSKILSHLNQQI